MDDPTYNFYASKPRPIELNWKKEDTKIEIKKKEKPPSSDHESSSDDD